MRALLVCLMLFFLGCQGGPPHSLDKWMQESSKCKVLSTTAMIEDLVAYIGGDEIEHIALITGEIDPHSYELVKGDGEKITRADIVFSNGLSLEHGASVQAILTKHPCSIALGDQIAKHSPEKLLYAKEQVDPHLWMDISLWTGCINPIVDTLSEKMPEKAAFFRQNGRALKDEMLSVHEEIKALLHAIPENRRYLVTSHDAFHYFAAAYLCDAKGQDRCAAPEGLAPEGQLSAADIYRIVNHLCEKQIAVVFPESNVSRESLKKIISSCESRGQKVAICAAPLYGDAMGEMKSYLAMMRHNAQVLKQAWESDGS